MGGMIDPSDNPAHVMRDTLRAVGFSEDEINHEAIEEMRAYCDEPVDVEASEQHFGVYCPYCRVHLSDSTGRLVFYPAREIAQAHLDDMRHGGVMRGTPSQLHLWAVVEFGQEKLIDRASLAAGAPICPLL